MGSFSLAPAALASAEPPFDGPPAGLIGRGGALPEGWAGCDQIPEVGGYVRTVHLWLAQHGRPGEGHHARASELHVLGVLRR